MTILPFSKWWSREHSHVVGGRTVHLRALPPPPKVAAADDEPHLDAHLMHFDELVYDPRDDLFVEPEALLARERFAREL